MCDRVTTGSAARCTLLYSKCTLGSTWHNRAHSVCGGGALQLRAAGSAAAIEGRAVLRKWLPRAVELFVQQSSLQLHTIHAVYTTHTAYNITHTPSLIYSHTAAQQVTSNKMAFTEHGIAHGSPHSSKCGVHRLQTCQTCSKRTVHHTRTPSCLHRSFMSRLRFTMCCNLYNRAVDCIEQ